MDKGFIAQVQHAECHLSCETEQGWTQLSWDLLTFTVYIYRQGYSIPTESVPKIPCIQKNPPSPRQKKNIIMLPTFETQR